MSWSRTPSSRRLRAVATGAVSLVALALLPTATALAAAPQVVTVPWRGTLDLPHETYNGKQVHLKGVARGLEAGATATWDPGDGTGIVGVVPNPVGGYDFDLGITHTYPSSAPGTPYTATLTVCNNLCASDTYRVVVRARSLDVEIDIAIDEGLWYLHRSQVRTSTSADGQWNYAGYVSSTTGSALQAFQINGHLEGNDANQDPYADTVARGLKFLFTTLSSVAIGIQPYGNPDVNGNGIGLQTYYYPIYEGGMVLDAIVTTKTPGKLTTTGPMGAALPANVAGRTYGAIAQDMVDMFAWGQYDDATYGGGWRYNWNEFPDNSACQWAAIGLLAARDLFGATVPSWVLDRNKVWLTYSRSGSPATGYGYTGPGRGDAQSPSGLVQAVLDGIQKTDAGYWVGVERDLAAYWTWGTGVGYQDSTNYYGMFALAKAMRLALPSPVIIMAAGTPDAIDWFKADCADPNACNAATEKWGIARTLLRDQDANGFFNASYYVAGDLNQAWGVIILTGTLQLEPVAVATASPNPGAAGVPINFDGTGSYHQDPAKTIVKYEWDWNNDGIADTTGATASHAFACAVVPCSYPVTLYVTDNTTPSALVDTATITVNITNPPHPPTADANGPYLACVNENVQLDGSASFDVDQPLGDSITAYGWELDFVPPIDFTDATGVSTTRSYAAAGLRDVGLKVTDNSAAIFGGPNLTHQDFTTAKVMSCDCVSSLAARPKLSKIQLTWAPVGGAASYDIYRSSKNATSGYSLIKAGHVTSYATYLDSAAVLNTTYWYRVIPKGAAGAELCGSTAASAKATVR